ncbi:MAG: PPC domain-containing protein, partial [Cyanobacteria bacterium P01_C01_bin.147]
MLQVSLFTGPDYLIEAEGTVSAHAFLVTGDVIPEGGLIVSVDALNLSEFDLAGVSVEGGEIVAVRDGGFDLRMTEYTTLVNLPIAADGETEAGETANFSLASGDGYEINSDYSGGTFNLVDTRADIPRGVVTEPNDIIGVAVDTQITPENPSFSAASSIYFDIGNRYLNPDGTYTYLDYYEDVDLYQLGLSAGDTVAVETFDVEGNITFANLGAIPALAAFDADGNKLIASTYQVTAAAPDKLFGTANGPVGSYNEDGTVDFDETESYLEFTAPEDGLYYVGVAGLFSSALSYNRLDTAYSIEVPGSAQEYIIAFGNYEIEIDLLTPDNPRKTGTPTPPVSNPNVINPPTLSLEAIATTEDSEGNIIPGVVEFVEEGGTSEVNFTIRAEDEIPEGGIEFVLNSSANLFDYVSYFTQDQLPSTIGGQSLGSFYNEDGIPTGIRLLIEEPTMTVTLEAANRASGIFDLLELGPFLDVYEPLENDGAEDITFFLQPGEGYKISPDAGATEVTYYDSVEDVPAPTGGGDTGLEVGVSISESTLIETEGTETTLTFTLSEPPPAEGLRILLDSEDGTLIGSPLSQFDVLNAEIVGGDFPIATADRSGFFFNMTEQTATITLAVFDELSVDTDLPPEDFQEGIVDLTFALQPQPGYTIDSDASEVNVRILDNPDSQIFVNPSASGDALIESEGTVGTLSLSLGAPPPAEGLTVSLSTDALTDFDTEAIEVDGGTLAAVRDNGLDITLTEQEATIRLPILNDGIDEGGETATFRVEPGDGYETAEAVAEVSFSLGDTLGQQVSAPEEIEGNSTLSEANALGLSTDNPMVSISGGLSASGEEFGESAFGYSEDVDFYSFTLTAGQTVTLDVDGLDNFSNLSPFEPFPDAFLFSALQDIPQQPDHELRLFDVEGNELAANNDGAAPGEVFSRDPYLEFTAETAGTYYVGVSHLGNRNYDPFVQLSGTGWTFPEVGVFNGFYDLTVTLTDSASDSIDIGLYDADTDTLIATLDEGTEVLASEILGKDITIAALVPDDSAFSGQVESMVLNLNQGQFTRTESVAPYALFSDRNGDFRGQDAVLAVGSNDITFDLYSKNRGQGDL